MRNRIPELLKERDLTPYRLAWEAQIAHNTAYNAVHSNDFTQGVSMKTLAAIAKVLEVKLADLWEEE